MNQKITPEIVQATADAIANNTEGKNGLPNFILIAPDYENGVIITNFHNVKSAATINALLATLLQAIDHELELNPNYSANYKKIFMDFKAEVKKATLKVNKKTAKFD